ncbi:MAG: aminopeptidase P family protein [Candidatus Tectomicrobia bacterium]|uniref:Aminopeptidase P family protein n=1 Tax=Tectimicrobiota bacterium TaxID=2528274 RepID=A0A932CSE7_UNCTE|nr:aminopeptidase P family protein [Candidatus Tectomicrobia bacterium]
MSDRILQIQQALRETQLDGWLFYSFRESDPLAYRILRLDPGGIATRRWYYLIPAQGEPVKLVHRIESHSLDGLPGRKLLYLSWQEQREGLRVLLEGRGRVAMQYSPENALPYISRVDAGTVELVRRLGPEVVSSADLVQCFEAVWSPGQLASHQEAAAALRRIVDRAFQQIRTAQLAGGELTEHDLQQFLLSLFRAEGLTTAEPPIVAVGPHSADPHYAPLPEGSSRVRAGELVLLDLWARKAEADSIYADITWTGYVGASVPEEYRRVFEVVRGARDAALELVRRSIAEGTSLCGWQVDDVARQVIAQAGYGDHFIHRTGHSIGEEDHGNGANLDNLETHDERRIIPHTGFSIEPGIYLEGRFGIRSEIDVYVGEGEVLVTGQPIQTEVIPILGAGG